jgi:hypothetical protein
MSRGFVPVPASAIRDRLAAAGFRLVPADRGEEVYERAHDRDARYTVKVYSSITRGGSEVRECGEDAIRVGTSARTASASSRRRRRGCRGD